MMRNYYIMKRKVRGKNEEETFHFIFRSLFFMRFLLRRNKNVETTTTTNTKWSIIVALNRSERITEWQSEDWWKEKKVICLYIDEIHEERSTFFCHFYFERNLCFVEDLQNRWQYIWFCDYVPMPSLAQRFIISFFFALAPIFFSERTNESDSFHFSRCWSVCVCMFFFPFFAFLVRSRSVSRKTHQNKKLVFLFTYAVEKPTATTTTSYGRWHRQPNNWNENEIFKRK